MIHIGNRRFIVSKRRLGYVAAVLTVVVSGLAVPGLVMGQAQETKLRVIAFGAHPDDCNAQPAAMQRAFFFYDGLRPCRPRLISDRSL